jgi:hypothetical protein
MELAPEETADVLQTVLDLPPVDPVISVSTWCLFSYNPLYNWQQLQSGGYFLKQKEE